MHTKKRKLIWKAVWLWVALAFFGLEGKAQEVTRVNIDNNGGDYTINKAGNYEITGNNTPGSPTSNRIVVNVNGEVNITIENVNISNISDGAFDIFNGIVNLTLKGYNSLYSTYNSFSGLSIYNNSSLTITEESNGGNLTLKGETDGAGIRVKKNAKLIIKGGNISATGGKYETRENDDYLKYYTSGAGIGGAYDYGAGTITISGGFVTAIGSYCDNNNRYISPAIGGGSNYENDGSFSTTSESNAFIVALGGIALTNDKENWHGIIVEDNIGKMYGDKVVLSTNASLPDYATLTIDEDQELTIESGVTLENKGTINCDGVINGTVSENKIKYAVTYDYNYSGSPESKKEYVGDVRSLETPTRSYYTFKGWKDSDGNAITTITKAITVKAEWEINDFTINNIDEQQLTYKTDYNFDFSSVLSGIADAGGLKSIAVKEGSLLPDGLLEGSTISGKPTTLDETGKAVTFIVTAVNGATKEIEVTFKVKKAELKVITGNAITKVYDGNNTVITEEALKLYGVKEGDDISLVAYQLTYDNTNAGTGKTITLPSFSVEGTATSNYNFMQPSLTLTGAITPKELIVTPASGQSIYQDEVDDYCPAFTLSETANEEVAAYEGLLAWNEDSKVFILGTLELTNGDNFSKDNYELKLSDAPVTIEIKNEPASADPVATAGNNDWYTSDITLSAPSGFQIKADGIIRSNDWVEQLVIDEEGSYKYAYSLRRDDQSYILANKTLSVNLDKTAPSLSVASNDLEYTLTFSDAGSGIDKVAVDGKDISIASGATTYKGSTTAGKHTATATDKAGNTATVEFELKTDVPPYEPPVPPTPSIYYDVTIPSVEGVTTDPVAGSYPVESYGSFSFILTVGEGYRENSQPVVKANGTVVTPRTSDGKYIVRSVTRDTEITIEGIVRDTPTANAEIDNGLYIRQSPHTLHITTPKAIRIRLIDFAGRIIRDTQLSPGKNHLYNIATGSYILQPESGEGIKVRVN